MSPKISLNYFYTEKHSSNKLGRISENSSLLGNLNFMNYWNAMSHLSLINIDFHFIFEFLFLVISI